MVEALQAGDIVAVKGSLGSRMGRIVQALAHALTGLLRKCRGPHAEAARGFLAVFHAPQRLPLHHLPHGGATATALLFVFFFGPRIIDTLRLKQGKGQPIRDDGPAIAPLTKKGTPTMGGLMILSGPVRRHAALGQSAQPLRLDRALRDLGFGAIGFYDDYLKVTQADRTRASRGRLRLAIEAVIALVACYAGHAC